MALMPFHILFIWLHGLISLGLIGLGAYLAREWYRRGWVLLEDPAGPDRFVFEWNLGWNEQTALLAAAVALLAWSLLGGQIVRALSMLWLRRGQDDPEHTRGGEVRRLRRPDGSELQVELYGPADAPPIVLTHGWGANATEWHYVKRGLADRYRLIAWDLPGLGRSTRPSDRDYSLENMARDLHAVLELAGDRPAVLLGHSIGGMITLTFCRLFPEELGRRVAGLLLVHTTYTNPVRTCKGASIFTALERPLIVPLLHLTIGLWPLVWLMNWLSYLNGQAHLSTMRTGFGGTQTPGQVEWAAEFQPHAPPDVAARGMFGMMHYDATATLPTIGVPTLVVTGDRDGTCKPEANERIAREVPQGRLATLSPARHMGLIEHHGRFNELVDGLVAACSGAAAR